MCPLDVDIPGQYCRLFLKCSRQLWKNLPVDIRTSMLGTKALPFQLDIQYLACSAVTELAVVDTIESLNTMKSCFLSRLDCLHLKGQEFCWPVQWCWGGISTDSYWYLSEPQPWSQLSFSSQEHRGKWNSSFTMYLPKAASLMRWKWWLMMKWTSCARDT